MNIKYPGWNSQTNTNQNLPSLVNYVVSKTVDQIAVSHKLFSTSWPLVYCINEVQHIPVFINTQENNCINKQIKTLHTHTFTHITHNTHTHRLTNQPINQSINQSISTAFWLGKTLIIFFLLCPGLDSNLWSWNPLDLKANALPIEPPHPQTLIQCTFLHSRPSIDSYNPVKDCHDAYEPAIVTPSEICSFSTGWMSNSRVNTLARLLDPFWFFSLPPFTCLAGQQTSASHVNGCYRARGSGKTLPQQSKRKWPKVRN